jgi:hypothetical protein
MLIVLNFLAYVSSSTEILSLGMVFSEYTGESLKAQLKSSMSEIVDSATAQVDQTVQFRYLFFEPRTAEDIRVMFDGAV